MGEPPREVKARGFWWSGDHRPEGILICKGKGILHTDEPAGELRAPAVYDLVPTILHLAGLAVPDGLDGRVLEEMMATERRSTVRYDSSGDSGAKDAGKLTEEEEKLIEEKLRALGYL